MPQRNTKRRALKSLLIVGEGAHDRAFVDHLKSLYDQRKSGQTVTVRAGDGGSPRDLLKRMVRCYQHKDYDQRVLLLDDDVGVTQPARDIARKHDIEMILSSPVCLEGMLLDVLGVSIPSTAQSCKSSLRPMLDGHPAEKRSYQRCFPQSLLDQSTNLALARLRVLISNHSTSSIDP
ncbi:hypothetical protein [Spiribacter salilacus]|uniref:hypothetical protein n=1 Tax=Spiribacter salilacus TaxID=2664894 RepID=UPI001C12CA7C|nr:hypothetical protein [Spiribacter salilacus]